MNPDPTIRKVVQVAEQAQQPLHVPVVVGNQCFIITQQDVRRIEDSRLYSYNKLNAKGEVVPMDTMDSNVSGRDAFLACIRQPTQFQQNASINPCNIGFLSDLVARACNITAAMQQQQQQQQGTQMAMTMPDLLAYNQAQCVQSAGYSPVAATLQQQLDWSKACDTMPPQASMHPLHYTTATSTTEIARTQCVPHTPSTKNHCCTRGCNTMDIDTSLSPNSQAPPTTSSATCLCARQQAKQRKMTQFRL
ncbi:uncharacterized protein LOC126752716 [Bactrocera neohumeralis]|uniref:uncharacterized protein LOC120770098 n=1 Tax=Bactrocera tryoni TaxID=59916 RepID=UPI001A95CFFE|nr:uncharacterized protein LOC120770098 [Bactrocera tryoni]XP_050319673.1 uncharacterized protein LOC126752716 [Bactrocera neohumeralis]